MDDCLEEANELYNTLTKIWNYAGMKPHKWLSNSKTVHDDIPPEEKGTSLEIPAGDTPL